MSIATARLQESSRSATYWRSLLLSYYRYKAEHRDPERRSARKRWDEYIRTEILRVWRENYEVYGVRKVWRQLNREGIPAARCTVERLMKEMCLQGAVRGKTTRTTISADSDSKPLDLVKRAFHAERPNQLWVADFTYVATWIGFVYVAFVIDVFSRMIVGWRATRSMSADLPLDALEQAILQLGT